MRTITVALAVAVALTLVPQIAMAQIGDQPDLQVPRGPQIQLPRRLPQLQPGNLTPINFSYDLPGRQSVDTLAQKMPEEMPVYEVQPQIDLIRGIAADFMDDLGIDGEFRQHPDDPNLMALQSGSWYAEIEEPSGTLFIGNMQRLWTWEPTPGDPMDPMPEDVAIESTLGLIDGYTVTDQINELMDVPDGTEFSLMDRQGMQSSVSYDEAEVAIANETGQFTGETQRLRGPAQVSIRPTVNGHPTVGPGGKLKIYFDRNNEFAGMLLMHRGLTRVRGAQPIISPQNAVRQLEAGAALRDIKLVRPERIIIRDIYLGYYQRGASHTQRVAQPVYVFEGTAFARDGEDRWQVPYRQYLPALQQPIEGLIPPGEDYQAQPHREIESPHDEDE